MTELHRTVEADIILMRGKPSDSDASCICCDGPHIYGTGVRLVDVVDPWGRPVYEVNDFVRNFACVKRNGLPLHEGKRVRITVEIVAAPDETL